eukprot:gene7339-13070_t
MFLPTCYTKVDIYFSYVAQMHSDGFGDSTEIVGKSCFFTTGHSFSTMSPLHQNKFTKCGICTLIKELKKECSSSLTREDVKSLKESHNDLQRSERRVYYSHQDKAKANTAKYLSMIPMDQSKTNIPHYITDKKEEDWVGNSYGKPFHVLSGNPYGEPPLLSATYAAQNSMKAMENGVKYCEERFTAAEGQWWREFLVEEKTNLAGWNNNSKEQLQTAGGLGWYLHKLEAYEKLAVPILRQSQDVEKKLNAVRERIAKRQKFKKEQTRDLKFGESYGGNCQILRHQPFPCYHG